MSKDVKDWAAGLTPEDKNLARNIMLLFTQSDIDVGNGYLDHYLQRIRNPEIRFMLTTFAAMEVVHVFAYAHLMETLGFPDSTFSEFTQYDEMRAKHDLMVNWQSATHEDLAVTMAFYGAFMEGLQLFASFIMLLNFQRQGKLVGMGQMVAWSVRDETLHCTSICRMFREFCAEYLSPEEKERVRERAYEQCLNAVATEDAFIDRAYEMGPVRGMSADDVKKFIRYVADRRLELLGYLPYYGVNVDPQPWFNSMISGVEHANFFEARPTEYSQGATSGSYW